MKISLLSIILFVSVATFLPAQTAKLKGHVLEVNTTAGVPEAWVALFRNDTMIAKTYADLDGVFEIRNLPIGKYNATAKAVGYRPTTAIGLVLELNRATFYDFRMKSALDTIKMEPIIWRFFSFGDSLGNFWCVDGLTNKKDSLGFRQGLWEERFLNYSDTTSGYRIGQVVCRGSYVDDIRSGKWTYYKPNGDTDRIEFYEKGKLVELKR